MPFDLDIRASLFFKEGEVTGMARLSSVQFENRFGQLAEWMWQRLNQATESQLELWGVRVSEAVSLHQVFAD